MNDAPPPPAPDLAGLFLAPARAPKGARKDTMDLIAKVAGGRLVRDLVFLAPNSAIDRRLRVPIAETGEGDIATIEAEVDGHMPAYKNLPHRIRLRDESGFLTVAYFRGAEEMLKRMWPVGQTRLVSGEITFYDGMRQMLHPDHVVDPVKGEAPPAVEPIYPLTQGLSGRMLSRAILGALDTLPEAPEWLEPSTVKAHDWPDFRTALEHIHRPASPEDVAPESPFRTRLAYDELFARQCALRLRRAHRRKEPGRAVVGDERFTGPMLASLPYAPTNAQARAVREIYADMAEPAPMLRLLQGDVGSGKTLVAALAMARAAEAGLQSALMAPTDILSRQHGATLQPLLDAAGVRMAVLTGRDKAKDRRDILERLASGEISVVIGTHALFQEDVRFRDLGLIVIDEQHRFGVSDRMRMVSKGFAPHVLVMSATPIPRTLALSIHGDMDLSVLDEKPPGRQPIATAAMPTTRIEEVIHGIDEARRRGERAYWVCPLIEESEAIDLPAVIDRHKDLQARFGKGVEIVHGQMPPTAREAAMERFRAGESFLMVATTVIEVGVNVPEATIMVIENAERFGLAQLHQLRGRVGRGDKRGSCVLLWKPPLGEQAKERLDALRRNEDGFAIAEIDFRLRGAGDMLGTQQSGLPPFRLASPEAHSGMLGAADKEARLAVERDPELRGDRGDAIRLILALFGYAEAAELARSG
ncbi:MAG: ATP-dependent DNA helicase RecG [Hyphomonadaceae bacterium]|nr:ATP-dependent DNA helicase RecG [Hyphomonadaceae bacterium]GIK47956.1 MAG: ATP-dependent DNA helicase RecG [Alphaproteobacteria bacterium]